VSETEQYGGARTLVLENSRISVSLLVEKGTDIVEFRRKDTDVNVLFEAPHNWQSPTSGYVPSLDHGTNWMDYYPGGWQDCLPLAGNAPSAHGAEYGIHGESSLLPWEYEIIESDDERVRVACTCELVRYPFAVQRTFTLERNSSTLVIDESIENLGRVRLPFVWLQHVAFGSPLLSDDTRIDLPGAEVQVEDEPQGESPLDWGESFSWPVSDSGTDLSRVPPADAGVHDLSYLHTLSEGWYAITNPTLDLGAAVSFDEELFESIWCWRACGGFRSSPFFGREYVLGFEPATGWPASDVPDSHEQSGTQKQIRPDERVETTIEMTLFRGHDRVTSIDQVSTGGA
jgi:galactose mutarotase-like enzyme